MQRTRTSHRWLGIAFAIGVLAACHPPQAAGAPTLNPPDTYVGLFKWRWTDIATECTKFLGPQGFGAVQISPPAEHRNAPNWWNVYQPVNHHNLVGDMGSASELQTMINTCHAAGVRIYADVVFNQMAAGSGTGVGGSSYDASTLTYPWFSSNDFHSKCDIDYSSATNTANCWLLGMPDLNTASGYVQGQFVTYLSTLVGMGVDGFRIDAAKHILASELSAMYSQTPKTTLLGEPVFITQEVIENEGWIDLAAYENLGTVNEFRFTRAVRDAFRNNNIGALPLMMGTGNGGGSYNLIPSNSAAVFVDNHDTERNPGDSLNLRSDSGGPFDLANIYMLTQPHGRAQLQSGFTFTDSNANAPAASPYDANGNAVIMGAWDFVHRWGDLYPMVKFRSATAAQPMTIVSSNGNRLAYRRGNVGFVALNNDASSWNATLGTGLPAGTYCNITHGLLNAAGNGCTGDTVTVEGSGTASLSVPARGGSNVSAIVIYTGQKVGGGTGFASNYPAMYLRGDMNSWGATAMSLVANHTWQTSPVTLSAGASYGYKYEISGRTPWSANWGTGNTSGVAALNGGNIGYMAGTIGTYVFTFNDDTLAYAVSPNTSAVTVPNTLGALYTPSATTFRIWSPDNSNVTVGVVGHTYNCTPVADFDGYTQVYEATVSGDLKDQAYQFFVGGNAVRDPYALMVNPGTTQGIVVDIGSVLPTDGAWAPTPALVNREDSIIYEVHVRDFTIDGNSGVDAAKRGKFMGMVQTGTSYNAVRTGIDHLKELGITHVQLLPVYDFGTPMYNWGYDPVNYNVPEEQYSQATTPEGRIREFKDMVCEFHKNGIRVIMDVVYNHTVSKEVFQPITAKYYTSADLSGTGNSIDDGNPMVSRMIRDSLEHWVRDYDIDGFRFDLMGIFYYADVAGWGTYLNSKFPDRNLLLYGEPWNGGGADPNEDQKVRLGKAPLLASAHIGLFNSQYRESIKGGNKDKTENYMCNAAQDLAPLWWGAIAAGMRGSIQAVKSPNALANNWDSMFADDPEQSINYVSAHDDLDLWDKIVYSGVSGGSSGYAGRVDRFAIGMILTSQGIPFIHAGDEFLRSKAYNGDIETAKNTYNAGDNYNMIRWADLVTNASTNQYYRDGIALRKTTPALRLTTWDDINSRVKTAINAGGNQASAINVVSDSALPGNVVVSYTSSNASQPQDYDTIIVFNPGDNFNLSLLPGAWRKVFDINGAVSKTDNACEGTAVTVFKRS